MSEAEKKASQDAQHKEPMADSETQLDSDSAPSSQAEKPAKTKYPLSFWLAFGALCLTGLISAMEGSIVSTSLPSIIAELKAAFQPLYGQLADLWGRRYVMILATAIFLLGSGICGGANSMDMLIWGRAVQGIGAGGINMLVDLIICDLVPMRERGNFIGLLFLFVSIGTTSGPIIGGALTDNTTWRWVFYINLPMGGAALVLLVLFLQVKWKKELSTRDRLKRIDVVGNAILVGATFSILYALTYGGTRYPWSAANIVAPFVLGFVGLGIFIAWESNKRWCPYPVMPLHHFNSRTASASFFISFMTMILAFWVVYFYPVYFQSVLGNTPTISGVHLLPFEVSFPIFAAVGGGLVSKTGRYKPIHMVATSIVTIAIGASSVLTQHTHKAAWAVLQIFIGMGLGSLISTTLQAVQAGLPESETAASTATWAYMRSLGTIWGVSVPAAIFNNRFDQLSGQLDPSIRDNFVRGQAYEHATAQFVQSFEPATREVVIGAYTDALRRVWLVSIAFGAVTVLSTLFEKELTLRTELDSEFGLAEKKGDAKGDVERGEGQNDSREGGQNENV
uniref:MFS-type efflux transporter ffsH n=1 Tax=Aspergillus flavipes TaxID=41900 RepID=FFSH_ASPFV|nr:RecName: Full=MFS-type efflux transporter ffsH; AltName: Full=Cytochalasans biosynthesis cluster protein ffsH [Aspergillus flavipes]QOG08945.1 FfsH [Aspergillus flavipes]